MKTFIGFAVALLGVSYASAQTYEVRRDTTVEVSTDKHKVETNPFKDNWFLGGGVGAQMFFGDHNRQMEFGDRLTPVYELYLGKWFTPGVGVRLGANGYKVKGLTQNNAYSDGMPYDKLPEWGYWLKEQEIEYYHVHADVLFNVTNLIGGYKEDRFYNLSPYLGLGWMVATSRPFPNANKPAEVSANIGLFNSFRLNKSLDLTLDVRGSMVDDRFDAEEGDARKEGILSAAVGVKYAFRRRNWEKPKTTIIEYNQADLNRLRDAVGRLANDNESLKRQLAEAKGKTITEIKVEKTVLAAPILVTFPINKSVLSNEARVNLGFFAKIIKEGGSGVTYKITGYADKGTGTSATNQRLSKERAEAIYNVLVREFGVNASQLQVDYRGGVDNMYYDDPRLSRAVIVIGE